MRNWLRRFILWLKRAKVAFFTFGVLGFAFAVLILWGPTEPHIRYVGMILQIMGLLTIVRGISTTRKLFGLPTLSSSLLSWLGSFPKWRLPPVTGSANIELGPVTMTGRATVSARLREEPTLEDRVTALEWNVGSLSQDTMRLDTLLEQIQQTATDDLSTERRQRQAEDTSIKVRLALSQTGGLDVSLMGVLWLVGGVIMTSIPYEIVALFHS